MFGNFSEKEMFHEKVCHGIQGAGKNVPNELLEKTPGLKARNALKCYMSYFM